MKIYLLYSNPFDEGDEIYGAFSSEEKAEKAKEVFASRTRFELWVTNLEVDELEKHFERALSDESIYSGHRSRYSFGDQVSYGKWGFSIESLDTFLTSSYQEDHKEPFIFENKMAMYATVKAKSKEEAEEIANKLVDEGKFHKMETE